MPMFIGIILHAPCKCWVLFPQAFLFRLLGLRLFLFLSFLPLRLVTVPLPPWCLFQLLQGTLRAFLTGYLVSFQSQGVSWLKNSLLSLIPRGLCRFSPLCLLTLAFVHANQSTKSCVAREGQGLLLAQCDVLYRHILALPRSSGHRWRRAKQKQ